MKILLTGASGQVGHALLRTLPALGELIVPTRDQLDLLNHDQLRAVIRSERPDLIVNCAAYTAVDQAESDAEIAHRINAHAPAVIAAEAKLLDAGLVHFSTDYVFDGVKAGPYVETDIPNPLNVYGASKWAGEQAIALSGVKHLILRSSWVFGMYRHNFLLTILRLAQTRPELHIVADQTGVPTWSVTIAEITAAILSSITAGDNWWTDYGGTYHLCSEGHTSWHGFAQAIVREAGLSCVVHPISSAEYRAPARRPSNSIMSAEKLRSRFCDIPHWERVLAQCIEAKHK